MPPPAVVPPSAGPAATAAPAVPADADFYREYLRLPPAKRNWAELAALLQAYTDTVDSERLPPPGFPPLAEVDAAMRVAMARLGPEAVTVHAHAAACDALKLGDLAAMRSAAEQLEQMARKHPRYPHAVERGLVGADLWRGLGDYAAALAALDRLTDDQSRKLPPAQASMLHGIRSEILRETGQLDLATAAVRASVQDAMAAGDQELVQAALLREADLALVTGNHEAVRAAVQQRLDGLPQEALQQRGVLLLFRGYAEAGMAGDDPVAVAAAQATLLEARSLVGGHARVRADLKRLHLALHTGDAEAIQQGIEDCAASLGPDRFAMPLSRDACELVGLTTQWLRRRRAGAGELRAWLPQQRAAVEALAREWSQQPAQRGGIGFLYPLARRELLAEGIALELALAEAEHRSDGAARALQILLDLHACTSLARARQAPACQLAAVQAQLLAPDRALLVYLPGRGTTWVFVADAEQVHCQELPGELGSAPEVRTFLQRLLAAPGDDAKARPQAEAALAVAGAGARALALPDELLQRVLAHQGLTVVGDDLIGGLPLEALPLADGRLLGEVLPIDHTGSLACTLAAYRDAQPVPRAEAAIEVMACTNPPASVPGAAQVTGFALPTAELQPGLDAYPTGTVHFERKLDRAAFLGRPLQRAAVVHLIAHAVRGGGGGERDGLLVQDGILTRADFDVRPMHGLLLLSACGAGAGPVRMGEGDGFASLAGAGLWCGAQAVIASRQDLLALDHLRLMAKCHAHLARGDSPARALQRARQEAAASADLVLRSQRALLQVHGAGQRPVVGGG